MDNYVLNLPKEYWPKFGVKKYPVLFRFFESKATVIVLSASNRSEEELYLSQCEEEKIPILKRKGGGGCVLLGPGCLILTFAFYAKNIYGNREYFQKINTLWINALQTFGIQNLSFKGISDICIGDKKIAGTSIFRKKHLLVYQGSLLVNPNLSRISKYLRYPSRAPDYRSGRSHQNFLTSLVQEGFDVHMKNLQDHCHIYFSKHMEEFCFENAL